MDAVQSFLIEHFVSLGPVMGLLAVEMVLATLIYVHYRKYASSMSGQQSFGLVLPFIALTTFLVISVVKSSFALSLGLVGALSIVRFRTPIKEPEELAYIFLAIASGIGLAAGQITLTTFVVVLILVAMTGMKLMQGPRRQESVFMSVDVSEVSDVEEAFREVQAVLQEHTRRMAMLRYEMHDHTMHLTMQAELTEPGDMAKITGRLRDRRPNSNITFFDDSSLPAP